MERSTTLHGWSSALQGFEELAAEWAIDGSGILSQFGIDRRATRHPGYPVPSLSLFGAMAELGDRSGLASVALHLLRRQTFQVLGSMGEAARSAPNLGEALNRIIVNLHIRGTGYVSSLEQSDDVAIVRYRSLLKSGPVQDVQLDYNIGAAVLGIRGLIGSHWAPEVVEMTRKKPCNATDWIDYFDCSVRFGADECLILFDAADLKLPLADSASGDALSATADGSVPVEFVQLVDREVIRELSTGRAQLPAIARALGINVRTVQRRLADHGTSYQQRLDEVRRDWAQHYLLNGQMPLTALAQMLGYDDLSTFSRTFKGWFGVSPSAWRKTHQRKG